MDDGSGTGSPRTGTSVPTPAEIADLRLPETAADLVAEYDDRIGHRENFIWKWLWEVFPRFRLSSVPGEHHETVREAKLLLTLYYGLVDDLGDVYGDRATFEEARKIPFPHTGVDPDRPGVDADYLSFTGTVWAAVADRIRAAPRFAEFREVFEFDLRQLVNAVHHGYLVNETPELATASETDAYHRHNMAIFTYADLDLMFSPGFETGDLRELRETTWEMQRLGRICNCVTTWERELDEADPTSDVVVEALTAGVVDAAEVADPDVPTGELVERIREAGIEAQFLEEWDRTYERLSRQSHDADSVDLADYVEGAREIRDLHLAARGRI